MELPLQEIWTRVFDIVRRERETPTVWLAMQSVTPLAIDGAYFVAALPRSSQYLAINLQDNETATVIEDALRVVTGRILAFRLISGETLADWQQEKQGITAPHVPQSQPISPTPSSPAAPPLRPATPPQASQPQVPQAHALPTRQVSGSWEALNERLVHGYKLAPYIRYAHGQAQFVLNAVQVISDTMDHLMPPPGQPRDSNQERLLAKVIERIGSVINLDPMFISLELHRYRQLQGKDISIPL